VTLPRLQLLAVPSSLLIRESLLSASCSSLQARHRKVRPHPRAPDRFCFPASSPSPHPTLAQRGAPLQNTPNLGIPLKREVISRFSVVRPGRRRRPATRGRRRRPGLSSVVNPAPVFSKTARALAAFAFGASSDNGPLKIPRHPPFRTLERPAPAAAAPPAPAGPAFLPGLRPLSFRRVLPVPFVLRARVRRRVGSRPSSRFSRGEAPLASTAAAPPQPSGPRPISALRRWKLRKRVGANPTTRLCTPATCTPPAASPKKNPHPPLTQPPRPANLTSNSCTRPAETTTSNSRSRFLRASRDTRPPSIADFIRHRRECSEDTSRPARPPGPPSNLRNRRPNSLDTQTRVSVPLPLDVNDLTY